MRVSFLSYSAPQSPAICLSRFHHPASRDFRFDQTPSGSRGRSDWYYACDIWTNENRGFVLDGHFENAISGAATHIRFIQEAEFNLWVMLCVSFAFVRIPPGTTSQRGPVNFGGVGGWGGSSYGPRTVLPCQIQCVHYNAPLGGVR